MEEKADTTCVGEACSTGISTLCLFSLRVSVQGDGLTGVTLTSLK
uniref:Uncharacterized protein n=1 Tax=Anguilla anguilla TaxID=7936 RepID=A0A0E9WIL7_ANGAN